ncbi:group II intron maturase-specific domain-containing protein, partial [Oligella urethralis]|uniref:group II intron maturase-specific domain-containing protein n=1 Tax=Oligella urethralis TaxID=90245 RepID=UPI0035A242A6
MIYSHYTKIQPKKLSLFKQKVKAMTKRNSGRPLASVIKQLNPCLRDLLSILGLPTRK